MSRLRVALEIDHCLLGPQVQIDGLLQKRSAGSPVDCNDGCFECHRRIAGSNSKSKSKPKSIPFCHENNPFRNIPDSSLALHGLKIPE